MDHAIVLHDFLRQCWIFDREIFAFECEQKFAKKYKPIYLSKGGEVSNYANHSLDRLDFHRCLSGSSRDYDQ